MKQNRPGTAIAHAFGSVFGFLFSALAMAIMSIGIGGVLCLAAFGGKKIWLAALKTILGVAGESAIGSLKMELDRQIAEFEKQKKGGNS